MLTPIGRISKYLDLKNCLFYDNFLDIKELIKTTKNFQPQRINTWDELSNKMLDIIEND